MDSDLIVIGALVFGILIGRLITPNISRSSKHLENKVDAIIEHLGVDFKPYKNTPNEVFSALDSGQRVKAIKLYRQFSGVGLKEASEVISYLENNRSSVT
jgi:hypothetical protein